MRGIIESGNFEGFNLDLLPEAERQKLLDFLDELGLKLSELGVKKSNLTQDVGNGIDLGPAGGMDILGFTADQWLSTFENLDTTEQKLAAAGMAVGGLMNAWNMYHEYQRQAAQKELREFDAAQNKKRQTLDRQLDAGYISQRQYNQGLRELERETDRQRAELEYKAQKREWQMNMNRAVGETAMAVLNGLQAKPFLPVGLAMGALAGTLGAIQIATVAKSKPVKGYEDGLYRMQRSQDGKNFNVQYGGEPRTGLVTRPTHFIAGEKMPEMIIDGNSWKKISPEIKDSLYREIGRARGYQEGYYPNQNKPTQQATSPPVNDEGYNALIKVLSRTTEVLDRIESTGITAYLKRDMENSRKLAEDIKEYNDWRNSNKR
jgi:tubulin-specific chaperone A